MSLLQVSAAAGTEKPVLRVISLAPHATELLYAAGANEQIIATVDFSDYPEVAKNLPRVGSYNRLDIEAILALKPDLIVAWKSGNPSEQIEQLKIFGLAVFLSEPRSLEDIPKEIRQLGRRLGTEKIAEKVATEFTQKLKKMQEKFSRKKAVKVFYQVWNQPLMTINGQHIISDVINLCGGQNVFNDLSVLAPKVNIESVIKASPEVIIVGTGTDRNSWLSDWDKWRVIPAVRKGQVYGINADLIVRHTPRIIQGAAQMCAYIDNARH